MKYFMIVIFSTAFSIWPIELSNCTRFQKLLKEYKDPDYSASDKDLYGNFWYNASLDKQYPDQPDITENANVTKEFSKNLDGNGGLRSAWTKSSEIFQLDQFMQIYGRIEKRESSDIKSNTLSGVHDTDATRERVFLGNAMYNANFERHFGFERLRGLPFWKIAADVDLLGSDEEHKNYDSHSTYSTSGKRVLRNVSSSFKLMPGIGCGRRKPVLPVYRAFEFERALKKRGLIDRNLSDSTMTALIILNASIQTYKLNYELWQKYFMQQLEQIILTDDAVRDSSLNALTLFTLYETILTPLPDFYHGYKMSINGNILNTTHYELEKYYQDESTKSSDFAYDITYGAFSTISLTYQVFSRLFFECSALKSIAPDEQTIQYPGYYNSFTEESLKELMPHTYYDFILNGSFYYFITNRILMSSGMQFKNCSKYKHQYTAGYLNFSFFIEDHISLNCFFQRTISEYRNNIDYSTITNRTKNDHFSIGLTYDL